MYEASVPLTYTAPWTDLEVSRTYNEHKCGSEYDGVNSFCKVVTQIDAVSNTIDNEFATTFRHWDTHIFKNIAFNDTLFRDKRGIDFIGDFASFCCNIATQRKFDSLVMQEESVKKQMLRINSGLEASLKAIAENSEHFAELNEQNAKTFADTENKLKEMQRVVNKLQNNTVRNQNEMWNLIWILLDFQTADNLKFVQLVRQFKKRDIINACNHNLIPVAVIEPTVLYNDLLTLKKQLIARGQDLAIPAKDLSRLYQIPICDCTLSHSNILIHIKIPVIQHSKQWTLFELKTTPFKWDQETCIIEHGTLYLAVSPNMSMEDNIRQIAGMGLHNCKPYHDKLCYIPRFAADSLHGPACARKLFVGDAVQAIAKFRNMRCYRSSTLREVFIIV